MKIMKRLIILPFVLLLFCFGCENNSSGSGTEPATAISTAGYQLEPLEGSDLVLATKYSEEGELLEKGFFKDNLPEGTWFYYDYRTKANPKRVVSYIQGVANGPYMEMSELGQIELHAYYKNNKLDGPWAVYKFGRAVKKAEYKNGLLDGVYQEFTNSTGKLMKEIHYVEGVENGPYRFFNDHGDLTMEYQYENGEKVSGGIIDTDRPNEPR